MILDDFIAFIKTKGIDVPSDIIEAFYLNQYGPAPTEWTKEQKELVKKAAEKELKKHQDRFNEKAYRVADEVVDHLWRIGWEVKNFKAVVFGIEKAVEVFLDEYYKQEDAPLTVTERDDPWWMEVEAILNTFWQVDKLDDREVRMFIRNKGDIQPYIFQTVCGDLTFRGGTDVDWQPRSILKAAKEWWEVDRKHFENKNKPAPKKQTIHEYEEENKKELEAHAKWLAQLAGR